MKTMKNQNKLQHILNGNRNKIKDKKTCYKIMTINKGNAEFSIKQDKIKHILNDKKPDIVAITEANMPDNNEDIKNERFNFTSFFNDIIASTSSLRNL